MPQDKKSPLDMFLQQQEDCDRPACEDTVNALSSALHRLNKKKEASSESIDKGISSSKMCPPTKDVIGSSSWTLLHSMVRTKFRSNTVYLSLVNSTNLKKYNFDERLYRLLGTLRNRATMKN